MIRFVGKVIHIELPLFTTYKSEKRLSQKSKLHDFWDASYFYIRRNDAFFAY